LELCLRNLGELLRYFLVRGIGDSVTGQSSPIVHPNAAKATVTVEN